MKTNHFFFFCLNDQRKLTKFCCFSSKHWHKGFPQKTRFFQEHDFFAAFPTKDEIFTYMVETPRYFGAAFESQADSAYEWPHIKLGERISWNTIKERTETKNLAHDSQTWFVMAKNLKNLKNQPTKKQNKRKKLQNYHQISHVTLNLPALYSQPLTKSSLLIFEALPQLEMMCT